MTNDDLAPARGCLNGLLIGAIIWAIIILLAGCAQTVMQHPDKSDINPDLYECKLVAEQRAANWGAGGNPLIMNGHVRECLEHRGWSVVENRHE